MDCRVDAKLLLFPSSQNDQMEEMYGQRQPALPAAFIWDSHPEKWFVDDIHVKLMQEMA